MNSLTYNQEKYILYLIAKRSVCVDPKGVMHKFLGGESRRWVTMSEAHELINFLKKRPTTYEVLKKKKRIKKDFTISDYYDIIEL